jgi:hypothetical protein
MSGHTDGTPCLEGTQRLPPNFRPCCDSFEQHTKTCDADLRFEWWEKSNKWVTCLHDGSGIEVAFCLFCGNVLDSERASAEGTLSRELFDVRAAARDMLAAFKKTSYPEMSGAAAKLDRLTRSGE